MVEERDERYDGEEGEYHFSDEQMNYDDLEAAKPEPLTSKQSALEKLSKITPKRRVVIAGLVFIILMGVVYKMLAPSTTQESTEFASITSTKESAKTAPIKTTPPAMTEQTKNPIEMTMPAVPTGMTNPAGVSMTPPVPAQSMPAPPITQAVTVPSGTVTVPLPTQTSTATVAPPVPPTAAPSHNVEEKIASVEQQNAAIMNLLQTEYAQKMSDYEMQANLVRGKMDELNKRMNRIEANLNQMTELLQQGASPKTGAVITETLPVAAAPMGPKVMYNVQAIIPGRAWLKSDSGDTVTVAEGDILKDYGRITKIDPYDGVVEIDTGHKTIALSYGMNVE